MAVGHLLREVLEGGEVSREELLRRVKRFQRVAVLRPDGYLAWTLNGRTQQKVGPVEWKEEAFRARSFELGRFYIVKGWVFRQADVQLHPIMEGPGLAEVYDDADIIGRTLDGAEEAFIELYHAMGQLLSHPTDSMAALLHLPEGVRALIASSPEYLERFRYMTRGEQIKALSKLTTTIIVTFGTAGGTTSTLTRTLGGLEATVPVLSLSADGLLAVRSVAVSAGTVTTTLEVGVGSISILHMASKDDHAPGGESKNSYVGLTRAQLEKARRSFIKLIEEHEKKLLEYRTNPFANDNLGKLKNQPPEIQRKIIEGRIEEVERQLKGQRLNLKRVEEVLRTLDGGT
jgi:hypothetical protein